MNTADHSANEPHPEKKSTIGRIFKWLFGLLLLMVIAMAAFVVVRFRNDAQIPYDTSTEGITIPTLPKSCCRSHKTT